MSGDSHDGLYRAALDALTAGVCVIAPDGRVLVTNRAWREPGQPGERCLPGRDVAEGLEGALPRFALNELMTGIRQLMKGSRDRFEAEFPLGMAEDAPWTLIRVTAVDGGAAAVVTAQDITQHVRLSASLRRLATTDHLTGLANRRLFYEFGNDLLSRMRKGSRQGAVLLIDLDRFKEVNDTWGHSIGDSVLIQAAAAMVSATRQRDVVARLGGEEFAILAPSSGEHGALVLAERVRKAVERRLVPTGDAQVSVTASLGVTLLASDDKRIEEALCRADRALYRAKADGRNSVVASWKEDAMSVEAA